MIHDQDTGGNCILSDMVAGLGQIAVGCTAIISWCLASGVQVGWFFVGAILWGVSVGLKMLCARMINKQVIGFLHTLLPYYAMVAIGGLYLGAHSSLFEMGLTLVGVLIWPSLGQGAGRAIAIGVGAGAIEAFLLGIYSLLIGIARHTGGFEWQIANDASTRLGWLLPPVERTIAVLCHASSRALILLGAASGNYALIFWGFLLFTLLDGTAGAAHISGKLETTSLWRVELALTPFALASILILVWCWEKFNF